MSHFFVYLVYESLDGNFVCHVADISLDVGDASFLVVVEAALESCLIDVVEDDGLDACFYEGLGDVETNAVGCACDPGVLSFK